jgi:hypothetical protein
MRLLTEGYLKNEAKINSNYKKVKSFKPKRNCFNADEIWFLTVCLERSSSVAI